MTRCRALPPEHWPALAEFIVRHNRRPDGRVRCLHAEQGDSAAEHAAELRELPPGEALFLIAGPDDHPDGLIGAEFDAAAGRAWLRGPLLRTMPPGEAATLRRALIEALVAAMPATPRFDAFPQADEAPLVAAYRGCGFVPRIQHHVLSRSARPDGDVGAALVRRIDPATPDRGALDPLLALHDRLFPATYLPGPALLASLVEPGRQLWVVDDAQGPAGYVYVQQQASPREGYVDYLGVDERARGRGWGRALLDAAVRWALLDRGLPQISLTVRADREPALGLYRAAGFKPVASGWQLVHERPASHGG
jgi:ribosomal protein S18 acetylase RimI-like enzyme